MSLGALCSHTAGVPLTELLLRLEAINTEEALPLYLRSCTRFCRLTFAVTSTLTETALQKQVKRVAREPGAHVLGS